MKAVGNILKIILAVCVIAGIMPSSFCRAGEVIKIGGTGSGLGVMKMLGGAFEKKYRSTKVHVLPSLGSTGGIKAVAKRAIDIGVSARPLKDDEKSYGLAITELARTPFVVVARKDTQISDLSTEDLAKIYNGSTRTWPDGRRIRPVLRPDGEFDTLIARRISPEMDKAITVAKSREGMRTEITDQDAAHAIEKTSGALGFCSLAQIITERLHLKILSLNGVPPTTETLSDGSYKPYKALFLVTETEAPAKVRNFLDFVRSPDGIKMLESSGYVVLKIPGR